MKKKRLLNLIIYILFKKMPSFIDIIKILRNFIKIGINTDLAIKLVQSLYNLPQEQQQHFANYVNNNIMRIAPEAPGNPCPLEGSAIEYLWQLYIYRAIWCVCCYAKDQGEILTVDSPCIIVLFVCLKMEERYTISDVLVYFELETRHLENELV